MASLEALWLSGQQSLAWSVPAVAHIRVHEHVVGWNYDFHFQSLLRQLYHLQEHA